MKHLALLCIIALSAACSSPATKTTTTDSTVTTDTTQAVHPMKTPDAVTSLCFVRTEGKNNVDSTYIQVVVKNNTITGEMNWLPFQKDTRKGLLNGTMSGDTIKAVWTFKQEGMTDTMRLEFKLDDHNLVQKPLKVNGKTGRQQTDDAAGYTVAYKPFLGKM